MKRCKDCKKEREFFHKDKSSRDGLCDRCKDCNNAHASRYRKSHMKEMRGKFKKNYHKNRVKYITISRAYYWANRERIRKQRKVYEISLKSNPEKYKRIRVLPNIKSIEKYPNHRKARVAVREAVERGKLPKIKTLVCVDCKKSPASRYDHHKGYEKINWLEVQPLCSQCDGNRERERGYRRIIK